MSGFAGLIEAALAASYDFARGRLRGARPKVAVEPDRAAGFVVGTALPLGNSSPEPGTPVVLSESLLSKHVNILGGSGAGKSTLLRRMRMHAYRNAFATLDVDFLGDSADIELRQLAAMGADAPDVALMDVRRSDFVAALNVLGGPGSPHARAAAFAKALGAEAEGLGVRVRFNVLSAAVALADLGYGITEFGPLFAPEPGFRRHVLERMRDEAARAALAELDRLPPETLRTYWLEIANKLHNFLYDPELRLATGQTGFPDLGRLLDRPSSSTLLALGVARQPAGVLVAKVLIAALERHIMARSELPEERRQPLRVFLDEASRVAGFGLESLLAEGRRMRCSLTLAMQHTGQAEPALREALRANCSTQVYFAAGGSEASELAGEIVCDLPRERIRETLIGLRVGQALVVRRGEPAVLVEMPDSPVPKVADADVAALRTAALAETGVPRDEAETAMRERAEWIASLAGEERDAPRVVSVKRPMGREAADG